MIPTALFGDIPLATRVERAEASLIADSVRSGLRLRPDSDAFAVDLAGGVAAYGGPHSPFNKVAGLGFAGAPGLEALFAREGDYARRGCPVRVELSSLADPAVAAVFAARGYRYQGCENVLGCRLPLDPAPPPVSGVEVAASATDELSAWLDVVITGFAHADDQGVASDESFPRAVLETAITDMAGADGFARTLARREGAPAGAASVRIANGVAILCGASTLPAHRRRGVQRALLLHRLRSASEMGCDLAVVTTQPGSKSQENVQRLGFALLYTRVVLILDGVPESSMAEGA